MSATIEEDGIEKERIFLIVTNFSEGYGFPNTGSGSVYREIDGKQYYILKDAQNNEYTVREDEVVYNSNGEKTEYVIKNDKTLLQNGTEVGNDLLSNSQLKVFGTAHIEMIYSDDFGKTWDMGESPIDTTSVSSEKVSSGAQLTECK